MKIDKEIRSLNDFEIRQIGEGEDKQIHVQGYALTFNQMSEDLGFREVINHGALDNCDMSDVVLNFNHDNSKILARNSKSEGLGSLTLTVDDKGLFFDAIPTDTSYSRDLITNMESGILGKCSFAFRLDWLDEGSQSWDWDDGKRGFDIRTINKISSISDISVVVNPAYESTSSTIYQRSKEERSKELEKAKQDEIRKLEIELMKLELS